MISRLLNFVKWIWCKHQYITINPNTTGTFYVCKCFKCGHQYYLLNEDFDK